MPAVIPLIVAWTQTSIVGWIFGAVVKMAAAYAISRALSPKPGKLGSMGNPITMSRDAAAARRVIYGQTRASGPIIFAHVAGTKNSDLHIVIALAGHKLAEIGDILINDEIVELDVDGNATTSKYVGKLRVHKWLGDQTTADALLVTESGGVWTSAHICQGIACIYAKLVFDQDVFPQGIPNISAIVKGREVYDPRDESTAWTDNPALCALDYMRDTDVGFAATDDEIDYASHAAAASVCDEAVTLAAGGTEKRYRCAGVFATDGEPASIVEQLVGTMSGTMVYSGGKFSLKAGAYEIPTVEFDESHLRGPIQFQTDSSRREVCNIVKGTYTSVDDLFQPRDFPQWVDAAAVTADGEEITRDLALDWVHSPSQSQRLAAIEERASRLGGTIILQCNLSGLRVQVGDTITVKNARFGWTAGEVFRVVQFRFSAGDGAVGVDLTCRRAASSVYAWTAASEEVAVTPGAVPETGGGAYTIPTAADLPGGDFSDLDLTGFEFGVVSGGAEFSTLTGSATLNGRPAYTSPASPPNFYLRETYSGAISIRTNTGDCGTPPSGNGTDNEWSGETVIDPLHFNTETTTGNRKRTTYSWGDVGETNHSQDSQIDSNPDGGATTLTVTPTTSTVAGTAVCVSGGISSVTTGTAKSVMSVPATDEDALTLYEPLYSWSSWASGLPTVAFQQRTTGTFSFARAKVRGTWTGGTPDWEYYVVLTIEGCAYGSDDWAAEESIVLAATAGGDGTITLPETEITCPKGRERRVTAVTCEWDT